RRRAGIGQVCVDHPLAHAGLRLVDAGVAADVSVAVGPQRDDPGGELPRGPRTDVPVHDRLRPGAVEVEVVARRVEVPRADAGWPAADLGEPQPLRAEEPLHVRGAGADAQRLVDPYAQLAQVG